jgi:hypothetical protein
VGYRRARVRFLRDTRARGILPSGSTIFPMGTELVLLQWQRASGLPKLNQNWWTEFDAEESQIVNARDVEVVEILDEDPDNEP